MSAAPCPVPSCGGTAEAGRLLCRRCWFQVPKRLRDDVWHWWRKILAAAQAGQLAALQEARGRHAEAKAQAIEIVERRLAERQRQAGVR